MCERSTFRTLFISSMSIRNLQTCIIRIFLLEDMHSNSICNPAATVLFLVQDLILAESYFSFINFRSMFSQCHCWLSLRSPFIATFCLSIQVTIGSHSCDDGLYRHVFRLSFDIDLRLDLIKLFLKLSFSN